MPRLKFPPGLSDAQRFAYSKERRLNKLAKFGMRRRVIRAAREMVLLPGLSDEERESLLGWLGRNKNVRSR